MKSVAIILVNWNGGKDTLECLASLYNLVTHYEREIIVVDNASTDQSVEMIKRKYPDITLIKNQENLGFAGGNNIGIRYSLKKNYDAVWLLNNDTVVDKHSLEHLMQVLEHPGTGITVSKIYFYPGREFHKDRYTKSETGKVIWYAGGTIDWDNIYPSHRGVDEVDHGQYDVQIKTEFATGCTMLIKKAVFERIGLLNEAFYLYLEDVDFSIRAQKSGFSVIYVPESVVFHKNAASSSGAGSLLHQYYMTRNRWLVGMKYAKLRTKLALFREILRFTTQHGVRQKAAMDWLFHRLGKQYE